MGTKPIETEVLERYVQAIRDRYGWSQNELARKADVDPATISRMLSGQRQTRRSTLTALERASRMPLPPELVSASMVDGEARPAEGERGDTIKVFHMIGTNITGSWWRNEAMPDAIARPPALAEARAVFAIRMPDSSMAPWRRPNELVFINPLWAVAEGDHVLLELNHPSDPNHARSLYRVRRFLGITRNGHRFGLYDGSPEEIIPAAQVVGMTRALEWQEVAGIR